MGNISSSSCCSREENDDVRCCCFGIRSGMKGGKMVPADLHSSGAQSSKPGKEQKQSQSRPATLQTQHASASGRNRQEQTEQKFEFSLHGVQKTSPIEQSDENLNIQGRSIDQKFLTENVSSFYNIYKDEDCDEILPEGVARFCADLAVDPAEFIVLALAWKFKASTMCKFTREEFTQGCIALRADSITSLKNSFQTLEAEALENFKELYKFAFQFGLDVEQGQRSLPSEVAIGMWQVVFAKNPPPLLDDWFKFLEDNKIRGISRDTWNMFLHFTENVGADLSSYDDNEAWPSLFDDFVEYFRNKEDEPPSPEETTEVEVEMHLLQQEEQKIPSEDNHTQQKHQETDDAAVHIPGTVLTKEEIGAAVSDLETSTSRNSLSEYPSTTDEPSSEFDSDPIRCETLHSSHLT